MQKKWTNGKPDGFIISKYLGHVIGVKSLLQWEAWGGCQAILFEASD